MEKLRVMECFGGIGACSKALERLGIDYEIADYVEIDKYAVASFNAIHNTNFEPQDITKWDKDIEVDLIMHGSPCQDFSLAGKQAGGDEGTGTRSSLMYETIRIVKKLKPKYVIWENVKNLLSKKHRHNFDAYLETMEQLGYNNYYQVLNAKDYGIPQNRERVFTISILGNENYEFPKGSNCGNRVIEHNKNPKHQQDLIQDEEGICRCIPAGTHGSTPHLLKTIVRDYEFPLKQELKLRLKDMLEDEVDEKYYIKKTENIIFRETKASWDNSGKGYNSQQDRAYYQDGLCPTLSCCNNNGDKSQVVLKDQIDCLKINVLGNYSPSKHDASRIVDENGLAPTVKENHGTVTDVLQRFEFPPKQELKLKLKDMLEDEVDEKYYLSEKMIKCISATGTKTFKNNDSKINLDIARPLTSTMAKMHRAGADNYISNNLPKEYDLSIHIKNNTKKGYLEATDGDGCYISAIDKKRGTVQKEMIPTLKTSPDIGVVVKEKYE